jgi:hypothetical protein
MSAYFPHGTDIYDLHFFVGTQYLGSKYYESPLTPCTWYEIPVDSETLPECITIYLTDEEHNIIGRIASWLVGPAVQDITEWFGNPGMGPGIWPCDEYWCVEVYTNPDIFPPTAPTNIWDLHFYTEEWCDPAWLGEEYFQEPLPSDAWYDFSIEWLSSYPPPDYVFIEVTDETGLAWAVAFAWPMID